MCCWGHAWALGFNSNAAMNPMIVPEAWAALQKAQEFGVRRLADSSLTNWAVTSCRSKDNSSCSSRPVICCNRAKSKCLPANARYGENLAGIATQLQYALLGVLYSPWGV